MVKGTAGLHRHRQQSSLGRISTAKLPKRWALPYPKEDMKKETLFDKIEFDPAKPEEYVKKFSINNMT